MYNPGYDNDDYYEPTDEDYGNEYYKARRRRRLNRKREENDYVDEFSDAREGRMGMSKMRRRYGTMDE